MADLIIIGGGILTMSDLEKMNEEEVRDRKYKTCVIDAGEYGSFSAKVAYSETSKAWEPTQVWYNGRWITIDEFDVTPEGSSYSCIDFKH